MKAIRIILVLIGTWATLMAQGTEKTVTKPDGQHTYHYFKGDTEVSSEIHWNREIGKGQATAFARGGKEIYRQQLSMRHLIQSVQFSYYDDGAVKSAHYSWHPDAGIQRGGNTTYFDPQGNVTSVVQDMDPHAPLTLPGGGGRTKPDVERPGPVNPKPQPQPSPKTPQQEVVVEAPIYQTEYFVVNTTKKPLALSLLDNQGKPLPPDKFKPQEIQPGDTLRGGSFINAGHHGNPCDYVQFRLSARRAKWVSGAGIDCKQAVFSEPRKEHRKVYYHIRQVKRPVY